MTAVGPGWTDHSSKHIAGLFPLAVERYYNSAMAAHAPAVTTVTATARYYALHGYLAGKAAAERWSTDYSQRLLRRCEVAMALSSIHHEASSEHRGGGTIHGADRLRASAATGSVSPDDAVRTGGPGYAMGSWGFWGPYRGSEIRLGILDEAEFAPGKAMALAGLDPVFDDLLDLARLDVISTEDLVGTAQLCVCQVATADDGEWLAKLFAGTPGGGETIGARQNQSMRLIAAAVDRGAVRRGDDLAAFIKYDPAVIDDPRLQQMPVARVWRGLCFRADSVDAWRRLWSHLCDQIVGVITREDLVDWLADKAPDGTLGDFLAQRPATTDQSGAPRQAELDIANGDLDPVLKTIAIVLLGGQRLSELSEPELLGFRGHPGLPAAREELSPAWVAMMADQWLDRSMRDFCTHLVDVLLNRSQRVAMNKSRFDSRTGRFVMPARVRVHDNHVVKLHPENAARPAFLLRQLLSLGTQMDIFAWDQATDRYVAGSRMGVIGV